MAACVGFCARGLGRQLKHTRSVARNFSRTTLNQSDNQTHFGFENVSEEEKEQKVYNVFKNVADKYDVMNDTMSGGVHRIWKDYFIRRLAPTPGTSLLDVAGGTGDIAFRYLEYLKNLEKRDQTSNDDFDMNIPDFGVQAQQNIDNETNNESCTPRESLVTISDINDAMLEVGKKKAASLGYTTGVSWLQANAEELPIDDSSYDAYTVAFGIRNMTHIDRVLSEAYRVLKPGGRFMCLEFSQVTNPLLRRVYDEYSFQVIPVMGHVIAGDWHSYQYLVESIRKFPNQEEFASMIRGAGFKSVTYENLMFGVAAVHSGFKI